MLLEIYLKNNDSNLRQFHLDSGIPESTVRSIDKKELEKWSINNFDAVAKFLGKDRNTVINELEELSVNKNILESNPIGGRYNLENRRYIGNKSKLLYWIKDLVLKHTKGSVFFDVFAGTGVVSKEMMEIYDSIILNDFLYSNNVIYEGFFGAGKFDFKKIKNLESKFKSITTNMDDDSYFSENFGNKFFSMNDAKIIGEIREQIENDKTLNKKEYSILVSSLLYSVDKIANTVGHYDAYRKKVEIKDRFVFDLITPLDIANKEIKIYREDSNELVKKIKSDVAFIDPPYNSRQYSRFYHLLENLTKWNKPKLEGTAMKPPTENSSDYSKSNAPSVFDDLISNINTNYIVVTYNNTYNSKSKSSKNKITHEEILLSLNKVGKTSVFEKPFKFFNAGKSDLKDHREYVFITEVYK